MGKALKKKMPFPAHLAPKRDGVGHNHERKPKETPLFLSFPYVCPEPVLVN
eukprot:COSAG06_NODE_1523_length_9173_cov_31.694682_10_plen_51_part_00